jgi:hypothetical protein
LSYESQIKINKISRASSNAASAYDEVAEVTRHFEKSIRKDGYTYRSR